MEEKDFVEVEILGDLRQIKRGHFINFQPLINAPDLNQVKTPFQPFDQKKILILNILLYFIITIQKNYKVFKEDMHGDQYKAICTKQLSNYYIRNDFEIEQYQFAFLSSKVLGMKIEQCAHIIYFIIYGRFASHPYINILCGRKHYDFKRKIFKKGKEILENLKTLKKRTHNHEKNTTFELQSFKEQLKSTLRSEQTFLIWNRPSLQTKNKSEDIKPIDSIEESSLHPSNFSAFIPQRISQEQNSSIFQALSFEKKFYQTSSSRNQKSIMRKQKFNEYFDINCYKIKSNYKRCPSSLDECKQFNCKNPFAARSDTEQMGKINYENFKNISNNLKMKNTVLDKIRSQCSVRSHKLHFEKQNNDSDQQIILKYSQGQPRRQIYQQNITLVLGNQESRKSEDLETINIKKNFTTVDKFPLKQLNLNHSELPQQNLGFIVAEEENQKRTDFLVNLLRNENSIKEKEVEQSKKIQYFSQTSAGFTKIDCRHKLQKYKSEYRKFMKTQLLDRIRQAN